MYTTTIFGVIGDNYYAHQVVKAIFPNKVLFQKRDSFVVALSEEMPLTNCFDKKVKIGKTKEVNLNDFKEGQEVQFSLNANPTKRIGEKRVGIDEKDLQGWLTRKLGESVELVLTDFLNEGLVRSKEGEMCHLSVFVTGILKIKSVENFKNLLQKGIGSAKGLGFGMLHVL